MDKNMIVITISPENMEAAKAVIREAFEAGRNGTVGDYSDCGFLYRVLDTLDAGW